MRSIFKTHKPLLVQTIPLAIGIFTIPLLIGLCFVIISYMLSSQKTTPMPTSTARPQPLHTLQSATELLQARQTLREAGNDTAEADLRLWAQRLQEPEALFKIAPPDAHQKWQWQVSQDGLYALAVAHAPTNQLIRETGLYDLINDAWLWTNALPWPHHNEAPHVFNRHTVVRYTQNRRFFALEINQDGQIVALDATQAWPPTPAPPIPARFEGHPCVAIKHNVFFTQSASDQALVAWPLEPLPGLRAAGTNTAVTAYSGNGLIKLMAQDGMLTLYDALTQTVLQSVKGWTPATNTFARSAQGSLAGDNFTIDMQSYFSEGQEQIERPWKIELDSYSGRLTRNWSPETKDAQPSPTPHEVSTADGVWHIRYTPHKLMFTAQQAPASPSFDVDLTASGIAEHLVAIEFLPNQRHLLLRSATHDWLLDFTIARNHGNVQQRLLTSKNMVEREHYKLHSTGNQLAIDEEGYGLAQEYDFYSFDDDLFTEVAPAYLNLRAEQFIANQAWGYAAAFMERAKQRQQFDSRAPRINPLLLARCQILAGQQAQARETCRRGLRDISAPPQVYNYFTGEIRDPYNTQPDDLRMLRYHLQGLLFAQP